MSARGRGTTPEADEFYETPAWCVHRLFDSLPPLAASPHFVEPCVGRGAIVRAIRSRYPAVTSSAGPTFVGFDIAERGGCACDVFEIRDVRKPWTSGIAFDACVTNPPFSLALEAAKFGLASSRSTMLLLRLNWLECGGSPRTEARAAFLKANPPDVRVLPSRPSFTGRGTDATSYIWACWGAGFRPGTWQILGVTPKAERR